MQRFNYRVTWDSGTGAFWVALPVVTVYLSGTTTLAAIYADELGTVKANPFTGPSTGLIYFYADDGKYKVRFSGGTPAISTPYEIDAELLDDTLGLSTLSTSSGITDINSLTAATQALVVGSSGLDFNIDSTTATHTLNLPTASASRRGALLAADWSTFNSKMGSLNGLTLASQVFAIGTSGTSPSWASAVSTHTLNLPYASGVNSGLLNTADFQSFSSKEPALGTGTTGQFLRGDKVWANLNTDAVTEATSLYFTTARARAALSATTPAGYNSTSGVISVQVGSGSQPGYISSADWTTFNTKVGAVSVGTAGTDFAATLVGTSVTLDLPVASPSVVGGKVSNAAQSFSGDKTFYGQIIGLAGHRRYVRYHTAPASVTAISTNDLIVVNKSTAGATAITLPSTPATGLTITIKDGKGDGNVNNITVTPAAGTVDGAANSVINTAYGCKTFTYNGVEWNLIQ